MVFENIIYFKNKMNFLIYIIPMVIFSKIQKTIFKKLSTHFVAPFFTFHQKDMG